MSQDKIDQLYTLYKIASSRFKQGASVRIALEPITDYIEDFISALESISLDTPKEGETNVHIRYKEIARTVLKRRK